ncbi:MAG TPA: hypothetical protein DDX39_00445 [Bacteroidales bacterium]|nr:MAG: hypothetical protein A2W98_03110 [Bacteroidetes bacterium GWF2_33_38]HBF87079.1 hypothetical protein [Bacteroidales bacterium]
MKNVIINSRFFCLKFILFLIVFFLLTETISAQLNYTFTTASGTYTANATPTTIHAAGVDDATSAAINIGFTFNYECTNYTQLKVCSNGWLTFNTSLTATSTANNLATSTTRAVVAPLWDDLQVYTGGTVNYKLTGTSPDQVFTVEWKTMEWNYGSSGDVISFQVKLYETTNVIEYIYTQGSDIVNTGSASIGLSGTTSGVFYSLDGTGASPSASTVTETTTLSTKPANGQIYRWTPVAACSGTPNAGTATPSPASVCNGSTSTISLSGHSTGCGISYQWQSASAVGGPYSDISGATSTSYVATVTAVTYYRCVTTCSNGGGTNTSSIATVTLNAPTSCYCTSTFTNTTDEWITNVTFNAIDNDSGQEGADSYGDYTAVSTDVAQGVTYEISVSFYVVGAYEQDIFVWFDWNQDGDFVDAGESFQICDYLYTPTTQTLNILVPATASLGTTRMRVMTTETSDPTSCQTGTYGETEDYTINVTGSCTPPADPGAITSNTPQCAGTGITFTQGACSEGVCYWQTTSSGTSTASSAATYTTATTAGSYTMYVRAYDSGASCWSDAVSATGTINALPAITVQPSNATINVGNSTTYSVTATGDGLTYQWQVDEGSGWSNISVAGTDPTYADWTTSTLEVNTVAISNDGFEYRCVVSGTCAPSVTSNAATLTVTASYCDADATTCDEYISNVQCGSISNNSATCTVGGYADYTAQSTSMDIGTGYAITVTNGDPYLSDQCGIWVDWNQDYDFNDANETIVVTGTPGNGPYTATITPPSGAAAGSTVMRIRIMYTGTLSSCGTEDYGEVEDYTINVTSPCTAPADPGAITSNSPQCAGTGITFTQGACSEGVCYWQTTSSGTSTASSAATYITATTAGSYTIYVRAYDAGEDCWSTAVSETGTINALPAITTQPTSTSISAGTSTSYTVVASGASLTYQWQVNTGSGWNNITLAGSNPTYANWTTATLNVNTVVIGNNGYQYRCIVSGTCAPSVTSNAATLTVSTCSTFDDCGCATALTVGGTCSFSVYSNATATASAGETAPGCGNYLGGDVWFTVTVPASGHLIFDSDDSGVIIDGGMAIYSGSCGALTLIECSDDDSENGLLMPKIDASGLTVGSTIYIRFWEYGNNNNGTFSICVYDPGLTGPCASVTNIATCGSSQTVTSGGSGEWNTSFCGTGVPGLENIYSFTPATTDDYYIVVTSAGSNLSYAYQEATCQSVGWTCIDQTSTTGTFGPFSLTASITYYFLVDDDNATGNSHTFYIKCPEAEGTYIHPSATLQGTYLGACMVPTCEGTYQDAGGAANYPNLSNSTYRTFCPDRTGKCLKADFTSMSINSSDYLGILNGPTQGSTPFWYGYGTLATPVNLLGTFTEPFVSTDQSGCLSFWFYSSAATNAPGWSIDFSCEDCGTSQTNNDCTSATAICGATNVNSASPGPGLMSVCGGCNLSENYSSWYYFEITESGRLDLNVKPEDFFEDYDVSLYNASDCNDLGDPVRCTYAMAPDYCYNVSDDAAYYISNVTFNTINNTSTSNSDFHSDYTSSLSTTVNEGSSYTLFATLVGTSMYAVAWFDWDKDMVFEATEYYQIGTGNNTTVSTSITIPVAARAGKTALRVYTTRSAYVASANACNSYSDGEIEDYAVFINDGTHCSNNVKDVDETGVDCGGVDCVDCTETNWVTNTGMDNVSIDVSEDVTGDSWVSGVPVNAGDSYYLLINNWSPGAAGFDLVWNFSEGGAMDCTILPIELLDFTANKKDVGVELLWTTANEKNNDYFTVMKSYDANIWKPIGKVDGAGNSNSYLDYNFYDNEILTQLTYYRLKQTDFDGNKTFSEIVSINPDQVACLSNLNAFAKNETQLSVHFNGIQNTEYSVCLYDITGKQICKEKAFVGDNTLTLISIPISELSHGVYNVVVYSDKEVLTKKVVLK